LRASGVTNFNADFLKGSREREEGGGRANTCVNIARRMGWRKVGKAGGGGKRPGGRKDGGKKGRRRQDGRDKEERLKEGKRRKKREGRTGSG
jgi:hypothetical protein